MRSVVLNLLSEQKKETLAEFVRRTRLAKALTLTDIEQKSRNKITNGYVSRIENGYITNPSANKLKALALGLGISEEELFAVVRGKPLDEVSRLKSQFSSMLENIEKLNPSDKAFVIRGLESLDAQIRERIEAYKKAPELYSIKGAEEIDLLEFLQFIKKSHPDIATDMILDILGNRNLEKYTGEQIAIVREFTDRYKGTYSDSANSALITTG